MVPKHVPESRLTTTTGAAPRRAEAQEARLLLQFMASLGLCLLFYDRDGRLLRETPAVLALLRRDPEEDRLRATARRLAGSSAKRGSRAASPVMEMSTSVARYVLRVTAIPAALFDGQPGSVVALTVHAASPLTDLVLREHHGLTPREVEVARLMGRGLTNADIARTLVISHHTAERHSERVLRKLRLSSRAAVAALLNALA